MVATAAMKFPGEFFQCNFCSYVPLFVVTVSTTKHALITLIFNLLREPVVKHCPFSDCVEPIQPEDLITHLRDRHGKEVIEGHEIKMQMALTPCKRPS